MRLGVSERIGLLSILPEQGDYSTMRVLNNLRLGLSFSEDELKKFDFRHVDGQTAWTQNGSEPVDIPIGEAGRNIIVDALRSADARKTLTKLTFPLYERLIVSPEDEP